MKGGKTPIHIQRWAPSDFQADEHVRLLLQRRAWTTLCFYRQFLDMAFMAGGDLPADPESLSACVLMPVDDVKIALAFCLGRLLHRQGDRLYQKRLRMEIADELAYRRDQAALGKAGGIKAGKGRPSGSNRGTPLASIGPPSPSPSPSSAPSPAPDARSGPSINPLVTGRRTELEREAQELVEKLAGLTGDDPIEIMGMASDYKGSQRQKLNPSTMTDDRLANTVRDLRSRWRTESGKLNGGAARGLPGPSSDPAVVEKWEALSAHMKTSLGEHRWSISVHACYPLRIEGDLLVAQAEGPIPLQILELHKAALDEGLASIGLNSIKILRGP